MQGCILRAVLGSVLAVTLGCGGGTGVNSSSPPVATTSQSFASRSSAQTVAVLLGNDLQLFRWDPSPGRFTPIGKLLPRPLAVSNESEASIAFQSHTGRLLVEHAVPVLRNHSQGMIRLLSFSSDGTLTSEQHQTLAAFRHIRTLPNSKHILLENFAYFTRAFWRENEQQFEQESGVSFKGTNVTVSADGGTVVGSTASWHENDSLPHLQIYFADKEGTVQLLDDVRMSFHEINKAVLSHDGKCLFLSDTARDKVAVLSLTATGSQLRSTRPLAVASVLGTLKDNVLVTQSSDFQRVEARSFDCTAGFVSEPFATFLSPYSSHAQTSKDGGTIYLASDHELLALYVDSAGQLRMSEPHGLPFSVYGIAIMQ